MVFKPFTCPQVIALAMDVFTDVDIFKEIITATLRGVAVYVLLDHSHFTSFLTMSRRAGINIQDLKVRKQLKQQRSSSLSSVHHLSQRTWAAWRDLCPAGRSISAPRPGENTMVN